MILTQLLDKIECSEIINPKEQILSNIECADICCDSRKAYCGSLFVCISGSLSDGHEYAAMAYAKMCRVFIAERMPDGLSDDAVVIITPDTRLALAQLSSEFYGQPAKKMNIIGITGTKGKTTSSLLIYNLLGAAGIPAGYIGSNGIFFGDYRFNTVNTTPESLDFSTFGYFIQRGYICKKNQSPKRRPKARLTFRNR